MEIDALGFFSLFTLLIPPRYYLIHISHQSDRLLEGHHHRLVVVEIGLIEGSPLTVLEPFAADLITADVKLPGRLRRLPEILLGIDVNPPEPIAVVGRLSVDYRSILHPRSH